MTQEKAHEIIRVAFGESAIAIGSCHNTIFWIYKWETEDVYKSYDAEKE